MGAEVSQVTRPELFGPNVVPPGFLLHVTVAVLVAGLAVYVKPFPGLHGCRVSIRKLEIHGSFPGMPPNSSVMSIPPSKKPAAGTVLAEPPNFDAYGQLTVMGLVALVAAQAVSLLPRTQDDPGALANCSSRFVSAQGPGGAVVRLPLTIAGSGFFTPLVHAVFHLYTLIVGLTPPLVNAETAKMSPFWCLPGPNVPSLRVPMFCWKNQIPIFESPFTAKRSPPNTNISCPDPEAMYSAA